MGATFGLRNLPAQPVHDRAPQRGRLGALLLGSGLIAPRALSLALARQEDAGAPLGRILCAHGDLTEAALYDALATQFGTLRIEPSAFAPDSRLIDTLGPQFCAAHRIFPLHRAGAVTVVATSDPARFPLVRPRLEELLGPVSMVLALPSDLQLALTRHRGRALARCAESRAPATESCRNLCRRTLAICGGLVILTLAILAWATGGVLFSFLTVLALLILLLNTAFAATMGLLWLRDRQVSARPATAAPRVARPVAVSLLVPLFREKHIAERLVQRLARLDYPAEQLDIMLVMEEDDAVTAATLAACALPGTIRCITVPRGTVQTKPRALNYALDFCRGDIVGIYDAEDAPDPGQIRAVVRQFDLAPPQVACLQGRLDYYNANANWMARCFTVEYATWFRVMLPGLARLGLVLPLGGTTLFFRRSALVSLGGWDAHNVTEDADLGLRLARRGYRTELLDSTTHEEANCRPWPWVRQRSRWLKGYAMTYLVHMRNPVALWRDLGARRFWGVQVLFLGNILGVLTAPLLWAFLLLSLGLPHPWQNALGGGAGTALAATLAMAAVLHWGVWSLGVLARGERWLLPWVPTLSLYHMLGTAAALKATIEIAWKPFFWDKTSHGHLSPADSVTTGLTDAPPP